MPVEQLKYSATHEWVAIDGDTATVGITDFAVHLLSDLVFAELPPSGKTITKGQPFGEVESVKAVSDLYAPLSGVIIASNERLTEHRAADGKTVAAELELLTTSPFEEGWLVKVRISNLAEMDTLMNRQQYLAHCQSSE
jgi:glycine cleavage system H protein